MKQYFKYFRIWFILLGVCAVITLVLGIGYYIKISQPVERGNMQAPTERVYDYADVLTDEEEDNLRNYIAQVESKIHHDVVLVTINESVLDMFGYENNDYYWDKAITAYADDFYDYNYYGYDEAMGDGVILVDNWYEGEKGTKFSTAGNAYIKYTDYMVDDVLDAVCDWVEYDPYQAYMAYVETVSRHLSPRNSTGLDISISPMAILIVAAIPAIIFIIMHMKTSEGKKTTSTSTYVDETAVVPRFIVNRDDFITKSVTSVRINTDSGSGGGGRSGGGRSGGHRSSSGRSHGGGSRRR